MRGAIQALNDEISETETDGEEWRNWEDGEDDGWEQLRAYDEEDPRSKPNDDERLPAEDDYDEESEP